MAAEHGRECCAWARAGFVGRPLGASDREITRHKYGAAGLCLFFGRNARRAPIERKAREGAHPARLGDMTPPLPPASTPGDGGSGFRSLDQNDKLRQRKAADHRRIGRSRSLDRPDE